MSTRPLGIARRLGIALACAALYGLACGSSHSATQSVASATKLPLLLLGTATICAAAYGVVARFIAPELALREVAGLVGRTYCDIAILLGSLSPVTLFLGLTIEPATRESLGEYPLFVGVNTGFVAVAGIVAQVRQATRLHRRHGLARVHSVTLTLAWLVVSLFAGGQVTWVLRPYFAPRAIEHPPFVAWTSPDHNGATSFYEAVANLVDPPELAEEYWKMR